MVDCARLESVYTERYRGFESPPIRSFRINDLQGKCNTGGLMSVDDEYHAHKRREETLYVLAFDEFEKKSYSRSAQGAGFGGGAGCGRSAFA